MVDRISPVPARDELQAQYNDLLALQDQTDHVPLTIALDAVGLALSVLGHAQTPAVPSFGAVLDLAQEGLDRWREKPHNAKWWRRIDGTPIPNDLLVNIADVIATSLSSTDREGK